MSLTRQFDREDVANIKRNLSIQKKKRKRPHCTVLMWARVWPGTGTTHFRTSTSSESDTSTPSPPLPPRLASPLSNPHRLRSLRVPSPSSSERSSPSSIRTLSDHSACQPSRKYASPRAGSPIGSRRPQSPADWVRFGIPPPV